MYFFRRIFDFLKKDTVLSNPFEKEYTEEEIFFYAKQRLADVFHLPVNEIMLDDILGEGKLKISKWSLLKSNELDLLNDDMISASWGTVADVVGKMYPNNTPDTLWTVKEYCEYMVCCYKHSNRDHYEAILWVLNIKK